MIKLEDKKFYYYDGVLYESLEEIKETFIEKYNLLDDKITDFVTDEENESLELEGNILIISFEKMAIMNSVNQEMIKVFKTLLEKSEDGGKK